VVLSLTFYLAVGRYDTQKGGLQQHQSMQVICLCLNLLFSFCYCSRGIASVSGLCVRMTETRMLIFKLATILHANLSWMVGWLMRSLVVVV